MLERFLKILIITCSLIISERSLAEGSPSDSIGITISGNHAYILHQVEKDENLFRLSLRYQVQIKDIVHLNPGSEKMIRAGQKLRIPYQTKNQSIWAEDSANNQTGSIFQTTMVDKQSPDSLKTEDKMYNQHAKSPDEILSDNDIYARITKERKGIKDPISESEEDRNLKHLVKWGETVYSISKRYHVTTQDITGWNRLQGNKIYVGQELIVRPIEDFEDNRTVNVDPKNIDPDNGTTTGNIKEFKDYDHKNRENFEYHLKNTGKANELKEDLSARNPEKLNRIQFKPLPIEYQLAIIFVATRGYLDSVPADRMTDFEMEYIDYMKSQHSDVLLNLREGVLDERATLIMRDVALDLAVNYQ